MKEIITISKTLVNLILKTNRQNAQQGYVNKQRCKTILNNCHNIMQSNFKTNIEQRIILGNIIFWNCS